MPNQSTSAVALITGASSGIGAATALEFARRGYRIALHYNSNEEGARRTTAAIEKAGGNAGMFQADLTELSAAHALAASIATQNSCIL